MRWRVVAATISDEGMVAGSGKCVNVLYDLTTFVTQTGNWLYDTPAVPRTLTTHVVALRCTSGATLEVTG